MEKKFVPIETLASTLKVSISTIRSWIRKGYIPHDTYIKVGKTYRFSESDVLESMLKARPTTMADDEAFEDIDKTLTTIDDDY
jgi:excisionase family DNA binding protein